MNRNERRAARNQASATPAMDQLKDSLEAQSGGESTEQVEGTQEGQIETPPTEQTEVTEQTTETTEQPEGPVEETQEEKDRKAKELAEAEAQLVALQAKIASLKPASTLPSIAIGADRSRRPLGQFKPVRAGTNRAKVLQMAHDGRTIKEMAAALSTNNGNIGTTFSCIRRDAGVDYRIDRASQKVQLIFPEGKSIADAIA